MAEGDGKTLLDGAAASAGTTEAAGATAAATGTGAETLTPEQTAAAEAAKAGKPAEGTKPDAKPEGAPEKYEFKFPEGIKADEGVLTEFTGIAKELNLTQDQAQKLVDLQTKHVAASAKALQDGWAKTVSDWADKAKADPVIGGEKFAENLSIAKAAIKAFGDEEFEEMFNATGVGSHPAFIRAFHKIGKLMQDDKIHIGAGSQDTGKSAADRLFTKM